MRLLDSLPWRRPAAPVAQDVPEDDFADELTEAQREAVFRRIVLTRWRHSANPSLQEMEHLRQVLPSVLSRDHFVRAESAQLADLNEALRENACVAACLRRHGLALAHPANDVGMSLAWLACGEGDALARLWMLEPLAGLATTAEDAEAQGAAVALREHMAVLGLGSLSFADHDVRALVRDVAVGPVAHGARSLMQDHDAAVSAHIDGLVALRMGPGWRESHSRALRRLGTRPFPPRPATPSNLPDPDEDFSFSTTDEEDFPLPSPPEPPAEAQTLRVVSPAFSASEKHLRRYAALERPLALLSPADPAGLADSLSDEFPWMARPIAHVAGSQALRARGSLPWFAFPPMLLVGPQGAGKTRFARRMAQVAGVPMARVNAAGQSGAIEILGHSPTYREAHPSAPVCAMAEHAVANPVVFIDEIDKFGSSDYNGDPRNALIPMLEAETARAFPDDFLRTEVDISQVGFIFTANSLVGLPKPLLDRLEVFVVGQPGPEHFDAIVGQVVADVAREHGLAPEEMPPLHPRALDAMRKAFARGTSIRRLKGAVAAAMRVSASHAPH